MEIEGGEEEMRSRFKTLFVILVLLVAVIAGGVNAHGQSVQAPNRIEPLAQVIQPEANYKVIVRENASDPTRSDVYLQDPATGQETFYMTLLDVYRAHYHNAEFHNGSLYIIHRTGGDAGYETNPDWMDTLAIQPAGTCCQALFRTRPGFSGFR
jgi:hypothetical protein